MKIKFNRLLVTIVGLVVLIGVGCLLWFCYLKPANETLKAKQSEYEPLAQYDQAKLDEALNNKEVEFRKADMAEKLYDTYMNRFMPMLDFGRRDTGMIDYWREYSNIKKVLEDFGNDPNVTTTITLNVPNPPTNPNDSLFDQQVLTYTGQVTVIGDYSSVLENMVRWSSAPRLVLVNANSITMNMNNNDPNRITATYGITCYVLPWQSGGAKIEMASGGAASTSGMNGMDGMGGMNGAMGGAMGPGAMPGGMNGPLGGGTSGPMGGSTATSGADDPNDK